MLSWIKKFWQLPTALTVAARQLEDAQRDKLIAEANAEHYKHQVKMLEERISRLKKAVTTMSDEVPQND